MPDDEFDEMFPGPGLEIPSDEERDRADALIAEWADRWNEGKFAIPRTHPDVSDEGYGNYLAGTPTNRAFLRSRLRRWWKSPPLLPISDSTSIKTPRREGE